MSWWYPVIRAARFLGVAPWELLRQPIVWQDWAIMAENIDNWVEGEMLKRARQGRML